MLGWRVQTKPLIKHNLEHLEGIQKHLESIKVLRRMQGISETKSQVIRKPEKLTWHLGHLPL